MSTISKALPTPPDNFSTQLAASVSSTDTTIQLDSTSGLPTEGVGQLFKKNADGEVVAGSVEFVHWTSVSGNSIVLSDVGDRGITGSDSGAQAYAADDYFEVWVSSYYNLRDAFDEEHNADGTHASTIVKTTATQTLTNKTLTSPTVDGDVSGDAVLDEDDMVSDSDTKLATQQSIKAYVDASVGKVSSDGWNTADAMTYASTTTVTIAGDVTSKYPKGTKIKLTQTTTKYFVVINATYSDPNTTLTLMGGSDFTVAEAAITDPFLSYESTPQGFPQWFAFTANATGFSSKTQDAGRIRIEGTYVYIWLYILGTSNANTLTCTIPVTLKKRVSFPCKTRDNNVLQSSWGAGDSNADASNTLSFYLSPSGSGWTTSNTKGVEFCLAQGELN